MTGKIYIVIPEKIGIINPNIYGHFIEHLGGVIYDGIWVGENSKIPNIKGIRRDLVNALRKISPSIIRWPGGCFSETYNWRDGIGPRDKRPVTANWWYTKDGRLEPNQFGTHEFIRFCRLVNAEPYITANIASIPPLEIRNWIEYCNFPAGSTYLASLRAENGDLEPFNVKYWGLGNENWGGGGNFTPEDYCTEFRRIATIVKSLDMELRLIACGAGCGIGKDDTEWTRRFFEKWKDTVPPGKPVQFYGYAIHYYCGTAGTALEFDVNQWYELLYKASYIEAIIERHRKVMDIYDPERKINLIIDEWGCWHPDGMDLTKVKNYLQQQSTMRDALSAGITLNIFNNHSDKIAMANIAQMVNCLQSLFLTDEEKFVLTPNYFVFDIYKEHQNGMAVRTIVETEDIVFPVGERETRLPVLNCSSSIKDDRLTITIVNNHFDSPCEVRLIPVGIEEGKVIRRVTLSAEDPHMYNDFDNPDRIKPTEDRSEISGKEIVLEIPKASVNLIEIKLI